MQLPLGGNTGIRTPRNISFVRHAGRDMMSVIKRDGRDEREKERCRRKNESDGERKG